MERVGRDGMLLFDTQLLRKEMVIAKNLPTQMHIEMWVNITLEERRDREKMNFEQSRN